MKLKLNKTYFVFALILFVIETLIAIFFKLGFIRHTFGDYLVVMLLYAIIRAFTSIGLWRSAILVLIISYCIELLQLTPMLHFFNLEETTLAKLILGTTFHFTDLVAYTLGVLTILFFETKLKPKFFNSKNKIL